MDARSVAPRQHWPSLEAGRRCRQLDAGACGHWLRIPADRPGALSRTRRAGEAVAERRQVARNAEYDCADHGSGSAIKASGTADCGRRRLRSPGPVFSAWAFPETALASFSRPFREGMMQTDRLRRLDDRRGGVWRDTVRDGGPRWSANTSPAALPPPPAAAFDVAREREDEQVRTPITVHAILLLYTEDEASAKEPRRARDRRSEWSRDPRGPSPRASAWTSRTRWVQPRVLRFC